MDLWKEFLYEIYNIDKDVCGIENISLMSKKLKRLNLSPYIFVFAALDHLNQGNLEEALMFSQKAEDFIDVFYSRNSSENNDYLQAIYFLDYMINNYKPVNKT